jgi:hypothetical protein
LFNLADRAPCRPPDALTTCGPRAISFPPSEQSWTSAETTLRVVTSTPESRLLQSWIVLVADGPLRLRLIRAGNVPRESSDQSHIRLATSSVVESWAFDLARVRPFGSRVLDRGSTAGNIGPPGQKNRGPSEPMGLGKLPATQTNAIEQPSPPNYWLSTEELKNRGASQTAAEMGQGRELSIAGKLRPARSPFQWCCRNRCPQSDTCHPVVKAF